jgi:hypothetical protein
MKMTGHAHVYVGVTFIESVWMQLEPATFCKANEDLFIKPRGFIHVRISTLFEHHFLFTYCGPAEVFAIEWTDLYCLCSCIDDLIRKALFVLVVIAFFKPEVLIQIAACSLTSQAPLAIVPFILPAVSFLPVHFQLKVVDFIELSMDTAEILVGLDYDLRSVDRLSCLGNAIFEPSHARLDDIQRPRPVSIPGASRILIPILLSRRKRTKEG